VLKEGKVAKMSFCGREECAMEIKEATNGGKIRGVPLDRKDEPLSTCAWCGKKATEVVYVAKAY
ncbi:proline--tRNA ligase, partial [Archaeoglobales archaeon]